MPIYGLLGQAVNMFVTLLTCFYVFVKSLNIGVLRRHKVFIVLWCLAWTAFCASTPPWFPMFAVRPMLCVVSVVFAWRLLKTGINAAISAFLLSYCVSYSLLIITGLLVGLAFAPFLSSQNQGLENFNEPVYVFLSTLTASGHFLLACLFFKIKRFKNGFPFLFKKYAVVVALIAAGVVLSFVSLIIGPRDSYDDYGLLSLVLCVPLIGAGLFIGVRRGISAFYIRKTQERGIELLERELTEKQKEIEMLTEQNELLRAASHKINHRLTAMERIVSDLADVVGRRDVSDVTGADIINEIAVAQGDIERLMRDYQREIFHIKGNVPLPSTKIKVIDEMFSLFSERCTENRICFHIKISGSILYMTQNIISQSRLEILLGDLLFNALTAVNASEGAFCGILVILGLTEDFYALTVFDSGVAFEADILARLGTEPVTAYPNTGGSGIGFMTTFETIRECGASLLISEKENGGADYSKSVTVCFDGKSRYTLETYRSEYYPNRQIGAFEVVGFSRL